MSNFQLSLIIIGALVLVIVIAYNAWTTQRNTPKRASPREGDKAQEAARLPPRLFESRLTPGLAPRWSLSEPIPRW